ncbi:molybdopterin-dependent oxidoreductase [Actinorugispora endophytica]|uniref:Biotin/methionine sulfoxide reductase n=1 Tax=Actinorugispora endophytica TaxID=1605990 RepID=A0A4V3D808_9ACTN|nr:molybdopterin-dependent oxidoreductase [Actinorugispora endophytica]TDQ49967.1 biotin/methionine sulfoxide reductase [Actinorugispora endophytica]
MAGDTGPTTAHPTSSHWGVYEALVRDGRVVGVRPDPRDPDPSPMIGNAPAAQHHATRVDRPVVRRRWLENGPGPDPRRGDPDDEYVSVGWDTALDLLAGELDRVRREHGDAAVYGGSYGWASAGRFHHAQSQLHRFLNTLGGYTRSVNTYSHAAVEVLFPHVVGAAGTHDLLRRAPTWEAVAEHTELLVSFGGLRVSNTWTASGGRAARTAEPGMRAAARAGTEIVSISPLRDDTAAGLGARWLSAEPGTDTAILLALIHVLVTDSLADTAFLARFTTGWPELRRYVLGEDGGTPKTPEWAGAISGLDADVLRALARRMAERRTLVNVGWSVQRSRYGEQPMWAGIALAACLGQIGLPGGGFATGYGSSGNYGGGATPVAPPRLPQGTNPVDSLIPVARVSDMLLHPGEPFDFDGRRLRYPDIRLVYWAGGNPFHHHQDLARLRRAFGRPDTVVVNETHWTATARHADIVLPATTTLERDDFTASQGDLRLRVMRRAVPPHGSARDEYDTFAALAGRLGVGAEFTEGRTSAEWLRHMYEEWRGRQGAAPLPDFDAFWADGGVDIPHRVEDAALFGAFRADPAANPLGTPSGRIELYSETVAGFGYPDCPGHAAWLDPAERPGSARSGEWPLTLVANQPDGRLHSQQDMGAHSRAQKVADRAPVRLHPADAAARGIAGGDVVRLFNDRGSCLAGAVLDDGVRRGVVQLSTGAWFDPSSTEVTCAHGNPNALTTDVGTSRLSHGCTGQLALVEAARVDGPVPPVRAFEPPRITGPAD